MKDKRTYTSHEEQLKLELNQVKIQRDIVLKKLNKALTIAKQLRTLIES